MKITTGTIARTIALLLALINQVFAILGMGEIPITEDMVYQLCTIVATIGTALIAAWKDNDFTLRARARKETAKAIEEGSMVIMEAEETDTPEEIIKGEA